MTEDLEFNFWCVCVISGFYACLAAYMRERMPSPSHCVLARLLGVTSFLLLASFGYHAVNMAEKCLMESEQSEASDSTVSSDHTQYRQAFFRP